MIENLTSDASVTPTAKKVWISPDLCLISNGYVNGGANPGFKEHLFVSTTTTVGNARKIHFTTGIKTIPSASITPAKNHFNYYS